MQDVDDHDGGLGEQEEGRNPPPSSTTTEAAQQKDVGQDDEQQRRRSSIASMENMPIEDYLCKQFELAERTATTTTATTESSEQLHNETTEKKESLSGTPTMARITASSTLHAGSVRDKNDGSGGVQCLKSSSPSKEQKLAHEECHTTTTTGRRLSESAARHPPDLDRFQQRVQVPSFLSRVGAIRVDGVNSSRRLEQQGFATTDYSTEFHDEFSNDDNRHDDDDDNGDNNNSMPFSPTPDSIFVADAQMIVVAEQQPDYNVHQPSYEPNNGGDEDDDCEALTCATAQSGHTNSMAKNRNLYWGLGIMVALLVMIGSVVGIVILANPDSAPANVGATVQTTLAPSAALTPTPSASPSFTRTESLTIAAYLYRLDNEPRNFRGMTTVAGPLGLMDILNQTDRNFTVFTPPEDVLALLSREFVVKFGAAAWSGHTRSLLRQHILPFALYTTDLGVNEQRTVQTMDSINSSFIVTRNSFRGVPLYNDAKDIGLLNGVVHAIPQFVLPTWSQKSLVEIVQQVNKERGGHLGIFLRLLNATSPSSPWRVALESYEGGPQTLVVPTNEAWLRLFSQSAIERMASMATNGSTTDLGSLMQNHVLVGVNIVCSAWTETTLDFQVSPNEVSVLTLSGNEVRIVREMSGSVLNGVSRIVVEDQFSDYGVVQVVDGVLIPPGFNASTV